MPPFEATQGSGGRATRYRELADLAGEDRMAVRLRGLAEELQRQQERYAELHVASQQTRRRTALLLSELDEFLKGVRTELASARRMLRPCSYSAEDLREESRLCREEARAALDLEGRRALAARALDFAMLGEQAARLDAAQAV